MTYGHRHRTIKMREGSWLLALLLRPLMKTSSLERAQRSRFAWRGDEYPGGIVYSLSLLGILHGLTGLTVISGKEWAR